MVEDDLAQGDRAFGHPAPPVIHRGDGEGAAKVAALLCPAGDLGFPSNLQVTGYKQWVSEGTRTPDTQDHNGVVELQPFLGIDEVFFARVLAELRLEGCDDPADVVLGTSIGSRHEDHAVVSCAAGQYGLDV
jgi:hypothetical protein